jgi:hypothetical protein
VASRDTRSDAKTCERDARRARSRDVWLVSSRAWDDAMKSED